MPHAASPALLPRTWGGLCPPALPVVRPGAPSKQGRESTRETSTTRRPAGRAADLQGACILAAADHVRLLIDNDVNLAAALSCAAAHSEAGLDHGGKDECALSQLKHFPRRPVLLLQPCQGGLNAGVKVRLGGRCRRRKQRQQCQPTAAKPSAPQKNYFIFQQVAPDDLATIPKP